MDSNLENGRKQLLSVIVVALLVSLVILALVGRSGSPALILPQLVRLGGTLVLCYFLYKKHVWARWVSGVLFAVGGLLVFWGSLALLGNSRAAWVLLAVASGYASCAVMLLFSKDLGAYMRGEQAPKRDEEQWLK